jgi:hypothetical protein
MKTVKDEKLTAGLELARVDAQFAKLHDQRPDNSVRPEGISRPQVMCPCLYRACISGSINEVSVLLGFTKETLSNGTYASRILFYQLY